MSNRMKSGGTPTELYNKRRSDLRAVESNLDDVPAVFQHDLALSNRAEMFGSVRLNHRKPFHAFNDVLDESGLTAYALLSDDLYLDGEEKQSVVIALVKQV